MESTTIHPMVYLLKLEDDCWYVGITYNLNLRVSQHTNGQGAVWTKLHKPIKIKKVFYPASLGVEREMTLKYMKKYDWRKVRGSVWCRMYINKPEELNESIKEVGAVETV